MISVKKKPRGQTNSFLASTIVQTSCTTVYCFLEERETNVPYFCLLHAAASKLCKLSEKFLTKPKDAHTAV